jgi:hypothetical protein
VAASRLRCFSAAAAAACSFSLEDVQPILSAEGVQWERTESEVGLVH